MSAGLARLLRGLVLAAIFAWCAAPFAMGTSMVPLSIGVLTRESDLVVHGRVQSVSTARDAGGHIITRVRTEMIEVWKGAVFEPVVQVTLAGGILGTRQTVVDGQPEYRPGEEVVLFLKRNDRGEAATVGLAQGKFEVWTEPSTGNKHVCNLFHGRRREHAGEVQEHGSGSGVARPVLSLPELKQEVLHNTR